MIRYAEPSPNTPPLLVVVVDTEEEFDWGRPFSRSNVAVTSVPCQERMHAVFSRHGIVPTYVIDYPVATTPASRDYLLHLYESGLCEIGAHLHPWVNPPYEEEVCSRNSFPGNLPPDLERRKLTALTKAIVDGFGFQPRIYKAGRYGIGPSTMSILDELGYEVDASVVPHTTFASIGGPDFRALSDRPYFIGGSRPILEIPLSIGFAGALALSGHKLFPLVDGNASRRLHLPGILAWSGVLERIPLTPEGVDLAALIRLTRTLVKQGQRVFSFCYHSPSLGVGNTPYVRTEGQLHGFLAISDAYFTFFAEEIGGRFTSMSNLHRMLSSASAGA